MNDASAIVFLHTGGLPFYLRCALESARVFNPGTPIYLLTNRPVSLPQWGITAVALADLGSPELAAFRRVYQHISTVSEAYERFCFERWFYLAALWRQAGLTRALHLDSDCLLFASLAELFPHVPAAGVAVSRGGSPHCAFLTQPLAPLLDFILGRFADPAFVATARRRQAEARAAGGMGNLTDMTLLEWFAQQTAHGAIYDPWLPSGVLDHNLHLVEGFVASWRWRRGRTPIKRVHWEIEQRRLVPYFQSAELGQRVRALTLHFQSGAKRKIQRYNRCPPGGLWPMGWRRFYYNALLFPAL